MTPIAQESGDDQETTGRNASARAYDAMIAAITIANELPLYSCNPTDFTDIDGLDVAAVAHPDRSI